MNHCKVNDDCHCSEKTENTITKLFYQRYSDQFEESAGDVSDEGTVVLYYHHPITGQRIAAWLEDGELKVKDF